MILLDDKEVMKFCEKECSHRNYCALKVKCDEQCLRQARSVVNWLYGVCNEHPRKSLEEPTLRFDCQDCMTEIKKELGM